MNNSLRLFLFVFLVCLVFEAFGFNGDSVTEGPVTLTIEPVKVIEQYDIKTNVVINVSNSGESELKVELLLDKLVDEMYVVGEKRKALSVPAGGNTLSEFNVSFGQGAFSALYPVHIFAEYDLDGINHRMHAVRVVKTEFSRNIEDIRSQSLSPIVIPVRGTVDLLQLKNSQVVWKYYDESEHKMSIGWQGSDQKSGTYVAVQNILRGDMRPALAVHPPWRPKGGTAFLEYCIKLPEVCPLILTFANAIRDNGEKEPASDGVTFRVWADTDKLYEKHIEAKAWQEGLVDLSDYAGREIRLRLESHPGPNRDTTCDTSYWARPVIVAGEPPKYNSSEQWQKQRDIAEILISGKEAAKSNTFDISLADGYKAVFVPGPNGLPDASIAIGNKDKYVIFDGFELSILKHALGKPFSGAIVKQFEIARNAERYEEIEITHQVFINGREVSLVGKLIPSNTGLKIAFECSERITDLALGSADQEARRVYYGHGYCIEDPEPFQTGYGGHNLSTSHVGFDFESGISLVTACDNPPDSLIVTPATRTYALHTHMNATLTLVPSSDGAFDAAMRYRPLYDKQPAAGFSNKAGRFVFDIWGGRYKENADIMQRMIDYGLTDSLLTMHVWQRWGYDYRLPDIFPPNPDLGTIEDMQELSALCRKNAIPWGLHDNYIDFYPDAEGYSYDHVAFTEDGLPIKAWINESRDAQSYRWRPDCITPFVKRNIDLVKQLQPTHYFIDVFTSINMFDFYDRYGKFHSFLETRKCWGGAFNLIRDELGGQALMTSEAGDDQLTGYIEGADCQFLSLAKDSNPFMIRLACQDWERVPWYDAVLHDKFSLHGVGYSGRYQGGRGRERHGIESDDYISSEMLTGHAMMIDRGGFGRGAIRKYYLGQDFIRSIAEDTIKAVEFIDDDIHLQKITWNSGAVVYVNRSNHDWKVCGKTLPPYGYFAMNGDIRSSIENVNDIVVEQAESKDSFYVNARGYGSETQLEITPRAERIEPLDGNRFKLFIDWDAKAPCQEDARVFLHFVKNDESGISDDIAFQGDFTPNTPIKDWSGYVRTSGNAIYVPDHVAAGQYDILVGIWSPQKHIRYRLRGDDKGGERYLLGKLVIQRDTNSAANIKFIPNELDDNIEPGWGNIARVPIDFGKARTSGAFRCELAENKLTIIPLPKLPAFKIELNLAGVTGKTVKSVKLSIINERGIFVKDAVYEIGDKWLSFETDPDVFAYELMFE